MSALEDAKANWPSVGAVDPERLATARLEAHWAVQIVAAFGATLLEAKPDDSHTNLEWLDAHAALATRPLDARRAALRLTDLTLLLLRDNDVAESLALDGTCVAEGIDWLTEAAGSDQRLAWGRYDLPERARETLHVDAEALAELARWYSGSNAILRALEADTEHASPVRCWPHHFDIATLISLDPSRRGEEARSVGVGMTPGDGAYPEPYFYVTPWPYPKNPSPPKLAAGHWHSEGWFGAVLTASELVAAGLEQSEVTVRFVVGAVAAARGMAGV